MPESSSTIAGPLTTCEPDSDDQRLRERQILARIRQRLQCNAFSSDLALYLFAVIQADEAVRIIDQQIRVFQKILP